jgi:hypothetical protein
VAEGVFSKRISLQSVGQQEGVVGWMSKIMGADTKRKQLVEEKQVQPAAAGIAYHPELVGEYKSTHRELEKLFAAIGDVVGQGDVAALSQALAAFKAELEGHVLSENVRFYGYLEQQLKGSPDNYQLVKGFHSEMSVIARQVVQFVRKWKETNPANSLDEFLDDYRQVGEVFARRIGAEERDLYPLYQPPG